MTHAQLVRRLTGIVSNLKSLRDRIDAITLEAKPVKASKKTKSSKPAAARKGSAIGRAIVYGGVKGKVFDRTKDGKRFACKMADGNMQEISAVYVYRQLSRKAKPAKKMTTNPGKSRQQKADRKAQAAQQPATQLPVPGAHDVAEDVAAAVIQNQKSA